MAKAVRRARATGRNRTAKKGTARPRGRRSHAGAWVKAFLALREQGASITAAAEQARISRSVVYARQKGNKKFAAAMGEARYAARDRMEDELMRRAMGYYVDVFDSHGHRSGQRFVCSDILLLAALNAEYPEKYRRPTAATIAGSSSEGEAKAILCDVPRPAERPPA